MTTKTAPYKAVFFDMGGVVVGSPFQGIADFEREHSLPTNYLNVAISRAGDNGAFQRLERGEVDLWAFYDEFSQQLSDPLNVQAYAAYAKLRGKVPKVDGRALFRHMMSKATVVNPCMVRAIAALRNAGYIVAALTNNFLYPTDERGQREQELILEASAHVASSASSSTSPSVPSASFLSPKAEGGGGALIMGQEQLKTLFDFYIESAILGLRKPDPAIYIKACEIAGVLPSEVVFLDDIGINLKSAQGVGMKTIRVELGKPEKAVEELERTLGGSTRLVLSAESKL
ncbi:hypothetical protein EC968_000664 [Mortierella alpina]|nr:hypothetical protein EC968_000664 [Mortierella alpina]